MNDSPKNLLKIYYSIQLPLVTRIYSHIDDYLYTCRGLTCAVELILGLEEHDGQRGGDNR